MFDHRGNNYGHIPVMVDEVLSYLAVEDNRSGVYVDGTTSTGGHSQAIAEELSSEGTLICLDLDRRALELAKDRLKGFAPAVRLYQANFKSIDRVLERLEVKKVDGILLDLGFSSTQVDDGARGFAFRLEGPLDMRMNRDAELTAEKIVNGYSYEELKRIIREYGEERWAPRIAGFIVEKRETNKINTTGQLVEIIEQAIPKKVQFERSIHPATKTFQALRIEVNDELENLETGLKTAYGSLKTGGVMVVLSYHSLEDRRVKQFFRHKEKDCICPPGLPICRCDKVQEMEILTDSPKRPSEEEVSSNPRARSARLRAARKIVVDDDE